MSLMVIRPFRVPSPLTTSSFSMRLSCRSCFDFSSGVPSGMVTSSSVVIRERMDFSISVSKRRSRLVRMPTSFFPWVMGMPEMLYFLITSNASLIFWSGCMVMGSGIMTLTERLTFSTILRCKSGVRFRWMMPMPPSCARAMARLASVTVSMGELTRGQFNWIFCVNRVLTST